MSHPESSIEKKERPFRVLRIGVDLDDTVFDLRWSTIRAINKKYGASFTEGDGDRFWYAPNLLRQLRLPEEEIEFFRKDFYDSADKHRIYRNSPLIDGAIEVLSGLRRSGHQIYVLTSRPPILKTVTKKQLEAVSLDWIEENNILIRDGNYWETIGSEEFKLKAIAGNFPEGQYKNFPGLDLHLDDMYKLLDHPLATEIKNRIFILNRYGLAIPKENMINNWWMFYKMVRCLARGEEFDLTSVAQC